MLATHEAQVIPLILTINLVMDSSSSGCVPPFIWWLAVDARDDDLLRSKIKKISSCDPAIGIIWNQSNYSYTLFTDFLFFERSYNSVLQNFEIRKK